MRVTAAFVGRAGRVPAAHGPGPTSSVGVVLRQERSWQSVVCVARVVLVPGWVPPDEGTRTLGSTVISPTPVTGASSFAAVLG